MSGLEIENFLIAQKFTKLLKSVLWSWFMLRREFGISSLLDHQKMPFLHLKVKLTLLSKTSKWKKLFNSQIFFFVSAACSAILSSNNEKT